MKEGARTFRFTDSKFTECKHMQQNVLLYSTVLAHVGDLFSFKFLWRRMELYRHMYG